MSVSKNESVQLDEFLADQETQLYLYVLELDSSDDSKVKVTPWVEGVNCSCGSSIIVDKGIIISVKPTGQVHNCCGKQLKVVEVEFKNDASIKIDDLMAQIRTNNGPDHHRLPSPGHELGDKVAPFDDVSYASDASYYQEITGQQKSIQHECPPNTIHRNCGGRHLCVYDLQGSCCGYRWCPRGTRCIFRNNQWVCVYN